MLWGGTRWPPRGIVFRLRPPCAARTPPSMTSSALRPNRSASRPARIAPAAAPRRRVQHVATVSVRYIVYDVDVAIDFYCRNLGFTEVMHPAPVFAILARGDLRLVLSAAGRGPGGGQAMP